MRSQFPDVSTGRRRTIVGAFAASVLACAALHLVARFTTDYLEQIVVALAWIVASGAATVIALAVAAWTRDPTLRRSWLVWALAAGIWLAGAAARLVDVAAGVAYLEVTGDVLWFVAPIVAITSLAFDTPRKSLSLGLFLLDAIPLVLLITMASRIVGPHQLEEVRAHEIELVGYPIVYLMLAFVGLQMLQLERPRVTSTNLWGFGVAQPLLALAALTWPAFISEGSLNAGPPFAALWTAGFLAAGYAAVRRLYAVDSVPALAAFDDSGPRALAPAVGTLGLAAVSLAAPASYNHIPAILTVIAIACLIGRAQVARRQGLRAHAGRVESEEKLRTLVSNVPGAVYRCAFGGNWTIEFMSAEIEAITGFPPSDFVGNRLRSFKSIEHPDETDAFDAHIRARVRAGEPFAYEYRIVHADGSVRWVLDKGQAAYGAAGEVLWIDGVLVDMSERKRAEAELEVQTGLLRLLQSVAIAANEAHDIEEALTVCIEEICGHSNWTIGHAVLRPRDGDELRTTGIWHSVSDPAFAEFRAASERARFARGVGLPGRVLATGEPVWLVQVTRDDLPYRGEATEALGIQTAMAFPVLVGSEVVAVLEFFSTRDMAPDPRLLGAMANVGAVLGRVVERRRAEVALEAQNEQLRQLDALKDEFVSLVSHELRTPLTSIRGYLELVLNDRDSLEPQHQQYLEVVERNSNRLLQLVSDLLFVAQVDAGRLSVECVEVDLAEIAAQSVQEAEPHAAAQGVGLKLDAAPARLEGDPARLGQLVDNLVSNAIKFTPAGGAVVVRTRTEDDGVVFEVTDSGIGIPDDERRHLFERFFRTSNARRAAIQGTGLGLVIVQAISEAHDGAVSLESTEGVGTTFRVDLPASAGMLEVA